jgi:hypothetical protein
MGGMLAKPRQKSTYFGSGYYIDVFYDFGKIFMTVERVPNWKKYHQPSPTPFRMRGNSTEGNEGNRGGRETDLLRE